VGERATLGRKEWYRTNLVSDRKKVCNDTVPAKRAEEKIVCKGGKNFVGRTPGPTLRKSNDLERSKTRKKCRSRKGRGHPNKTKGGMEKANGERPQNIFVGTPDSLRCLTEIWSKKILIREEKASAQPGPREKSRNNRGVKTKSDKRQDKKKRSTEENPFAEKL